MLDVNRGLSRSKNSLTEKISILKTESVYFTKEKLTAVNVQRRKLFFGQCYVKAVVGMSHESNSFLFYIYVYLNNVLSFSKKFAKHQQCEGMKKKSL